MTFALFVYQLIELVQHDNDWQSHHHFRLVVITLSRLLEQLDNVFNSLPFWALEVAIKPIQRVHCLVLLLVRELFSELGIDLVRINQCHTVDNTRGDLFLSHRLVVLQTFQNQASLAGASWTANVERGV